MENSFGQNTYLEQLGSSISYNPNQKCFENYAIARIINHMKNENLHNSQIQEIFLECHEIPLKQRYKSVSL